MNSGMWVLGLLAIPFLFLILALILINNIRNTKNTKNITNIEKKDKKKKFQVLLVIILLLPIVNIGATWIEKIHEINSYANVKNLNYEIEQIHDWEFNIYFYDEEGYYYRVKKQDFNEQYESEVYLIKVSKEKVSGLQINTMVQKTSKVYMKDYKKNKILVWNYEDYK